MAKFFIIPEIVPFKEDALTERGERVYSTFKVELIYTNGRRFERVIETEAGIGFTEEWIEETIQLALKAIEKDFPEEFYKTIRVKPNWVRFQYVGPRGMVQ